MTNVLHTARTGMLISGNKWHTARTGMSQQYAGCLSHGPSLMALAPTSLPSLSGTVEHLD